MSLLAADNRPKNGRLIHDLCDLWKALTDLDSGNIGGNRLERAPNLFGRFGLDFPHVLVGRSPSKKDVDDRFVT